MDHCILCDGDGLQPLHRGLVRCGTCGFVSADHIPSSEELATYYREEYFRGGEYQDYVADKAALQRNFRSRLRRLEPHLDPARHKHLYEIGSGYGFFLEVVRDRFDSVRGIDVTEAGVEHARGTLGLTVQRGDFLDAPIEGSIDVCCLWDTIEHLRAPQRYLEKIAAHTAPGALVAITTGDIGSLNARMRGPGWRLIHPPTHLHYFSKATLTRMLSRYGFDVVHHEHCGFWRSARTTAFGVLVLRQRKPAWYQRLDRAGLLGFDFYLNLFDISYVIARKR